MWPLEPPAAAPRCYPTSRFEVLSGGLVRDTLTQLVWRQDGSGTRTGCSGTDNLTCTHGEAQAYCAGLGSGFRLPTFKELLSLVDLTGTNWSPAINQTAFPNTPNERFWTSSPSAYTPGSMWGVNFGNGNSSAVPVAVPARVRCVRR